ncbi:MAG: hypothetical protein CMJ72_04145 [Planctomycetaceae bacterium]|nr:hypothetical protein [Planctomycetaceae bacterium]MCH2597684.1 hypothetical protein [Pirellulales bacterium]HCK40295.1 hypothetical protein [Planctomycetaceae bacterium]|tara:strand:+ start:1028 stop:1255 length:228 start_codon:yes stop_codon:yes gene_type:complete
MNNTARIILWTIFYLGLLTAVFGSSFFTSSTTELFGMTLPLPAVVCFWLGVGCVCGGCLIGLACLGAPVNESEQP